MLSIAHVPQPDIKATAKAKRGFLCSCMTILYSIIVEKIKITIVRLLGTQDEPIGKLENIPVSIPLNGLRIPMLNAICCLTCSKSNPHKSSP